MTRPPKRKRAVGEDGAGEPSKFLEARDTPHESEDIRPSPLYTIQPQERHGLQIFVFDDGSIGLTQTIDREPRTIALHADEAEILADRLPDAILAADKMRREGI